MKNFFVVFLMILSCGCSWRRARVADEEPATTLIITSTKTTNNGAPFYVILQFTDFAHFIVDDYQLIADLSATCPTNSSNLMPICLIPGRTEKRIARPPPGQSTAIYCLFTECGEIWKYLIDNPENCREVTIALGDHEIKSIETR